MMIIKLAFLALVIYSIATAEPSQQFAMFQGAKAFVTSVQTACTRSSSPCTQALAFVREAVVPQNVTKPATSTPGQSER